MTRIAVVATLIGVMACTTPPPPKTTPAPAPLLVDAAVHVESASDHAPIAGATCSDGPAHVTTNAAGDAALGRLPPQEREVFCRADGYTPGSTVYTLAWPTPKTVHVPLTPTVRRRRGPVRVEGRVFRDDDGRFYPLGASLFWALYGWQHNDRPRLERALQWLADQRVDYIRIFGQVTWADEVIDPLAPNYDADLGALIDRVYDRFGLRTQVTILASGSNYHGNAADLASRYAGIFAPRLDKVFAVEIANEAFQNGPDAATLAVMARTLRGRLPGLPIGLSAPRAIADPVGIGRTATAAGATFVPVHLERGFGDAGWRDVRQSWDVKEIPLAVSQNEPAGPQSSVESVTDPLLLQMQRAVGVMNGAAAFVFHSGAGVYGRANQGSTGWRVANLWEIENIQPILAGLRRATAGLPDDVPNWTHVNLGWPGFPFTWIGGRSDKIYGARQGGAFVVMPCGVDRITLAATEAMTVTVTTAATGEAHTQHLAKGERLELVGRPDQHAAFILVGQIG